MVQTKSSKETNTNELQNYINQGMIDECTIQQMLQMVQKEEKRKVVEAHPYKITLRGVYYYTYVEDETKKTKRREVKAKTRERLEDKIYEEYKNKENSPSVKDIFDRAMCRNLELGEIQKSSLDRYYTDFKRFFENPNFPLAYTKIKSVTETDLRKFMDISIRDFKLTAKTFSGLKTILNTIFRYAKPEYTDLSITNCLGDYNVPKQAMQKNKKKRCKEEENFTNKEYAKVYDYLYNNLDIKNIGLLIAFHTGLRVGELSSLKAKDFRIEYSDDTCIYLLDICRTEKKQKDKDGKSTIIVEELPKTEKSESTIIIDKEVYDLMLKAKELNPNGEYLFMNLEMGNRIRGSYFYKRLISVCGKLDIVPKSTHKIRRYYATSLHRSNAPDNFITDQIRHKDIATTRTYYITDNADLEEKNKMLESYVSYKDSIVNARI